MSNRIQSLPACISRMIAFTRDEFETKLVRDGRWIAAGQTVPAWR